VSKLEIFEHRAVGPLDCNCYIVGDAETREAIVIDPGGDADELAAVVSEKGLTVKSIVATHAHFDHLLAAERLHALTGAPFHLHDGDRPLLEWYQASGLMFLGVELPPPPAVDAAVADGDVLKVGAVSLEVSHTPGHSPGSISLIGDAQVFAGDLLFAGSVGRVDLPGGDGGTLVTAVKERIFTLPPDFVVLPGHGPATTVERERRSNPFVGENAAAWE
jgi:glyoxylase-like metal-dependent hydrolase (beta-lactamase superfamily II)